MNNLILIMAKLLPEDHILQTLSTDIKNYQLVQTEENKKKLEVSCLLFVTRVHTESRSLDEAMKDFDKAERVSNLLDPNPA